MTINNKKVLSEVKERYEWMFWLERYFSVFILSLFEDVTDPTIGKLIGLEDIYQDSFLFDRDHWYKDDDIFKASSERMQKAIDSGVIFRISPGLDKYVIHIREKMEMLIRSNTPAKEKLAQVYTLIRPVMAHMFLAHTLEYAYKQKLEKNVKKYVTQDIDVFIGDASFPSKKNTHTRFEEDMLSGLDPKELVERYGWLKIRDGFSEPFTEEEICKKQMEIMQEQPQRKRHAINIPKPLRSLFKEIQELVYYRTNRTDVFFETLYRARPIFNEMAEEMGITLKQFQNYTIQSLIAGKPKMIERPFGCIGYKGKNHYYTESIFSRDEAMLVDQFTGMIAFKGIVRARACVIKRAEDLGKLRNGDVLVAPMTFPSFITAMDRASAFVTDEGGITCHAAIVAREMKKPCIIGTKVATQTIKDGMFVEVNAEKGIVKIMK